MGTTLSPSFTQARARYGALSLYRDPDDPELLTAKQALDDARADRLAERIARLVAEAPPLSDERVDRLVAVLRRSSSTTGAGAA